jgi:hypothetical protein
MTRSVEECPDLSGPVSFFRRLALALLGPSGDAASPRRENCVNEGCVRPVERGERWCTTCGLERGLFRREARRPSPSAPETLPAREAGRR